MWQLKNLKTGETLNEPQKLPENWGPIFGMSGIVDRIGDLSWLGDAYVDLGWVVVGEEPAPLPTSTAAETEWEKAKQLLRESDWAMLPDVPMSAAEKDQWIFYRHALRNIRLQSGFPTEINWPVRPD